MFYLASSMDIALEIGAFLLPVIGFLITALGTFAVKKLLDWLGVQRSEKIDNMIDKYVTIGVESAQRFADKKLDGRTLDGKDKLTMAIGTVLRELDQSGIRDVGEQLIRHRIEGYLGLKSTAGNASGQPSTT